MKNPWVIIGVITVVLFGGAFWYADKAAEENNEGVEIISHTKGNPDASVTLVKYSDFSCPGCAAASIVVNDILEQYDGEVLFEYRHFPFISGASTRAAVAAEAAGQQGKFYEFHDLLFENQLTWRQSANPQLAFLQYAEELQLDMELFRRHITSTLLREHVQADLAEGRQRNVPGTPAFFLNGELIEFDSYEDFIEQVGNAVNGGGEATDGTSIDSGLNVEFGI